MIDTAKLMYYRYTLITGQYVLDTFESSLFSTLAICCILDGVVLCLFGFVLYNLSVVCRLYSAVIAQAFRGHWLGSISRLTASSRDSCMCSRSSHGVQTAQHQRSTQKKAPIKLLPCPSRLQISDATARQIELAESPINQRLDMHAQSRCSATGW